MMKLVREIYIDIEGCEGKYQVGNLGSVRSLDRTQYDSLGRLFHYKGKNLKPIVTKKGYLEADICGKRYKIHRLVAKAFISNPDNLPQINHIDGDKQNNIVSNLEWCNNSQNQIHAYKLGLQDRDTYYAGRPNRPVLQIDLTTNKIMNEYSSLALAGRVNNLNYANIRSVCLGNRNHCGGYGWMFKEDLNKK